jgi:hypothetical protein
LDLSYSDTARRTPIKKPKVIAPTSAGAKPGGGTAEAEPQSTGAQIGELYQCAVPASGTVGDEYPADGCILAWDPARLPAADVEEYMRSARALYQEEEEIAGAPDKDEGPAAAGRSHQPTHATAVQPAHAADWNMRGKIRSRSARRANQCAAGKSDSDGGSRGSRHVGVGVGAGAGQPGKRALRISHPTLFFTAETSTSDSAARRREMLREQAQCPPPPPSPPIIKEANDLGEPRALSCLQRALGRRAPALKCLRGELAAVRRRAEMQRRPAGVALVAAAVAPTTRAARASGCGSAAAAGEDGTAQSVGGGGGGGGRGGGGGSYAPGELVVARFQGNEDHFPGRVVSVNNAAVGNGSGGGRPGGVASTSGGGTTTVAVLFDDGDEDGAVPVQGGSLHRRTREGMLQWACRRHGQDLWLAREAILAHPASPFDPDLALACFPTVSALVEWFYLWKHSERFDQVRWAGWRVGGWVGGKRVDFGWVRRWVVGSA